MAKAKKLPSGMWRCQACIEGVRRSFTAFSKREAEYQAIEWQAKKKDKRDPQNLTVNELLSQYIDSKDGVLAKTTIIGYNNMKRNNFTDIKDIKVSKINEFIIQAWVSSLSKSLSPKTVRNIYGLFKAATKLNYNVTLPQKKKVIYNTPDVDTCKAILAATAGTIAEVPVLLAMWCSLRMSEIRGIRWEKVEEDKIIIDTARIHMGGDNIVKGTKTVESQRIVYIHPYLYNKIKEQDKINEWVVPYSANYINKVFHKVLSENNIKQCRFHDLRHANASIMLMLNFPNKYAMERGGWSTEDVLKNVYQQTFKKESKEMINRLDTFIIDMINSHENAHDTPKDVIN